MSVRLDSGSHHIWSCPYTATASLTVLIPNLALEVTQQSKARHKEEFLQAFSPFIADATALAYKGASSDIQSKLRRVVDVWRDRNIFEREIQEAMEGRLDGPYSAIPKYAVLTVA